MHNKNFRIAIPVLWNLFLYSVVLGKLEQNRKQYRPTWNLHSSYFLSYEPLHLQVVQQLKFSIYHNSVNHTDMYQLFSLLYTAWI